MTEQACRRAARCARAVALWLTAGLALSVWACGGRSGAGDAGRPDGSDAGAQDIGGQDLAPDGPSSLPWVSTYAGTDCNALPTDTETHRLRTPLWGLGALTVGPKGLLYFRNVTEILRIVDDHIEVVSGGTMTRGAPYGDGPMNKVGFRAIMAIAFATNGILYVAENETLRQVKDGQVTTLAGKRGNRGYVDGPGTGARFWDIMDIAIDKDGGVLVAEGFHLRRYKDGQVSTLAGRKCPTGDPHDDGPAATACFGGVGTVLAESAGSVLLSEDHRLRRLSGGQVTTVAGSSTSPTVVDGPLSQAMFFNIGALRRHNATLYFVDPVHHILRRIAGGQVTTLNPKGKSIAGVRDGPLSDALFNRPRDLAVDAKGNLYVSDTMNCRIRYVHFQR